MAIICRYGEIFLKGGNRQVFERALVSSISAFMKHNCVPGRIVSLRNRIIIETDNPCPFLSRVFGLISFSPAALVPFDPKSPQLEPIIDASVSQLSKRHFSSFKVHTQRLTPAGQLSSIQINERVGAAIVERFGARVDLENPSITLGIEIIDNNAYVFVDTFPAPGGLPVGVSGTVLVLMDEPHSELSALLSMKRGCKVVGISREARDFSFLDSFIPLGFHLIRADPGSAAFDTIAHVAAYVGASALITQDISLNTRLPILNPLIGVNEEEADSLLNAYEGLYRKVQ